MLTHVLLQGLADIDAFACRDDFHIALSPYFILGTGVGFHRGPLSGTAESGCTGVGVNDASTIDNAGLTRLQPQQPPAVGG